MDLRMINKKGKVIDTYTYEQYVLNDKQQFCVIGGNTDKWGGAENIIDKNAAPHILYQSIGKLDDQNFIFRQQIINSLRINNWNFVENPNPDIVLLTVKE